MTRRESPFFAGPVDEAERFVAGRVVEDRVGEVTSSSTVEGIVDRVVRSSKAKQN